MARKTNKIKPNIDFLIITNGKGTEVNYFTLLKKFNSTYDIFIEFENGNPIQLVEYAIKKSSKATYNQIWIVFDIDQTHIEGKFIPAIQKAEKNNIKYAFSNIAFEVWLLSHFSPFSKYSTAKELNQLLNDKLKNLNCKCTYNKNDINMLEKYFLSNYQSAIDNSKFVFQTKLKEHNQIYGQNIQPKFWEWNSCTTVFKLVEAMKLQKKE